MSSFRRNQAEQQDELFRPGEPAELVLGDRFDLADAFLRDPQLLADLFQRLLASPSDPVAADEDPPLAVVEPGEQSRDRLLPPLLDVRLLEFVGAGIGGDREVLVVAGDESRVSVVLPTSNGPRNWLRIAQVA